MRTHRRRDFTGAVLALALSLSASAQSPVQTQSDDYTRYELLAPGSAKFRILYEVTASTPGAPTGTRPACTGSTST